MQDIEEYYTITKIMKDGTEKPMSSKLFSETDVDIVAYEILNMNQYVDEIRVTRNVIVTDTLKTIVRD
jgi:hypothetical protein